MNPFQAEINRKLLEGFVKICINPQGLENWISCKSVKQSQFKNAETKVLCKGKMVGRLLKADNMAVSSKETAKDIW